MIGRKFKSDSEKEDTISWLNRIYETLDYYKASMAAGKLMKRYCDVCEREIEKDDYYTLRFDWADRAKPDCISMDICSSCEKEILQRIDWLREEKEND